MIECQYAHSLQYKVEIISVIRISVKGAGLRRGNIHTYMNIHRCGAPSFIHPHFFLLQEQHSLQLFLGNPKHPKQLIINTLRESVKAIPGHLEVGVHVPT